MICISIIVPFFNEEAYLENFTNALVTQTYAFTELILVDDGSTDASLSIANALAATHKSIRVITTTTTSVHQPGQKVVHAFDRGFNALLQPWDIICKFDADIIFPPQYLETMASSFSNDDNLGMFSGVLTTYLNGIWELENISTQHVRGPLKSYSKSCFHAIGGLRPALGWDTLDELLALYKGFTIKIDDTLRAKHLRPTGYKYSHGLAKAKGEVFYNLGYGLLLGILACIKWAHLQRGSLVEVLFGFFGVWLKSKPKLVSKAEGKFIRTYRWSRIRNRIIG